MMILSTVLSTIIPDDHIVVDEILKRLPMLSLLLLLLAHHLIVLVLGSSWLLKCLAQIDLQGLEALSISINNLRALRHHTLNVNVASVGRQDIVDASKVQCLARHLDRVRGR